MSDKITTAVVSSPRNGVWEVIIRVVDRATGRQDHGYGSTTVPCRDSYHAKQVADAYNEPLR